jgi:cytochrome c peroxidase
MRLFGHPLVLLSLLLAGCGATGSEAVQSDGLALSDGDSVGHREDGKRLFERETFGGNGRTCLTCHGRETGTVSPADAQARFAADPSDPLFVGDGSDDGLGHGATRMLADATVLITLPLPPNVSIAEDPAARTVTVRRGIPTTLNTPALDPVLMYDAREPDLESQALHAIQGHAASTIEPTARDLERIAEFQQTDDFFSSPALRAFARGGPPPALPAGNTAQEQRGRRFFDPVAIGPGDAKQGLCAVCHSGPMLNQVDDFNPLPVPPFRVQPGTRTQSVLVSELNEANNHVYTFIIINPDATVTTVQSPDPGVSLINGNFVGFPFGPFSNFKIPTLWGIKHTAPYFHDGSAKTLEDVLRHYATFFVIATDPSIDGDPPVILTPDDQADIVSFLRLL